MFERIIEKTRYAKKLMRNYEGLAAENRKISQMYEAETCRQQYEIKELNKQLEIANTERKRMAAVIAEVIADHRILAGIGTGRHINISKKEWESMKTEGKELVIRDDFPMDNISIYVKQ